MEIQHIVMLVIVPLAFSFNVVVILTLLLMSFKEKAINTRHAMLLSVAVSDVAVCLVGFPMELFLKSERTCIVAGYFVSSFCLVSMTHMVALSLERMLAIKYPFRSHAWFSSKKITFLFVGGSWTYGLLWGSFPWLGWGRYSYESESDHRCSIDIQSSELCIQTYTYSLLLFCYVIPIIGAIVCFVIVKREFKKMLTTAMKATGKQSYLAREALRQEKTFILVVWIMLTCFMLAWTPYAFCLFYRTIIGNISQSVLDFSSYMGKTSSLNNPIIYVLLYKKFRKAVAELFCCSRIFTQGDSENGLDAI